MTTKNNTPHSWAISGLPEGVFPGNSDAGRQIIRKNRNALLRIGALTRIGKYLVVFGAPYHEWLAGQAARVNTFKIAPNDPEHARKRLGKKVQS